jgi:hypothetical protein
VKRVELHVYPPADTVGAHEPSMACWCGPYRDSDNPRVVVHWLGGTQNAFHVAQPITETRQ